MNPNPSQFLLNLINPIPFLTYFGAMKTLVVVPTSKNFYEFGFSAPLAWLFGHHVGQVKGVFGFELDETLVKSNDFFIIELNWFVELYEFCLIVEYIKQHNPQARILFGGLFAALKYRDVFEHCRVDYFIQGNNELPLRMILDGTAFEEIPNMVGREFANPISYQFGSVEFKAMKFNLDWFPSYYRELEMVPAGHQMLLYHLPTVFNTKAGCMAVHKGCDHCMGSHHEALREIYGARPIVMDNDSLISILQQLDKKFSKYSLVIMSKYQYDFSGYHFQATPLIEIESPILPHQVENIFQAFDKCTLILPIYERGRMDGEIIDYQKLLELEDKHHRILFPAYSYHQEELKTIPKKNIQFDLKGMYAPDWAHWAVYNNFDLAMNNSGVIYRYLHRNGGKLFQMNHHK